MLPTPLEEAKAPVGVLLGRRTSEQKPALGFTRMFCPRAAKDLHQKKHFLEFQR